VKARKECTHCHEKLEATTENFYPAARRIDRLESICRTCRKAMAVIAAAKRTERQGYVPPKRKHWKPTPYEYTVIHDPDQEAGFLRGARIPREQLALDLRAGNYTPGMRLRDRTHEYTVVFAEGAQRLVEVKA
jgi:hypothetical protein